MLQFPTHDYKPQQTLVLIAKAEGREVEKSSGGHCAHIPIHLFQVLYSSASWATDATVSENLQLASCLGEVSSASSISVENYDLFRRQKGNHIHAGSLSRGSSTDLLKSCIRVQATTYTWHGVVAQLTNQPKIYFCLSFILEKQRFLRKHQTQLVAM